jgi:FkbM family methyltransferase
MTSTRTASRIALRDFCRAVPIRGRHRLVDAVGQWLSEGPEVLRIGGLKVPINHEFRACRFMYYSLYEEHLVNWIQRTIRPGDVILEPGSNIGYITAHLLAQLRGTGKVIAIEPSRLCVEQLQHLNGSLPPNLQLLNAAIAGSTGSQLFWQTPRIVSDGYGFLDTANWNNSTEGLAYRVFTHTVDELMDRFGLSRLAFLKLDVEGSEVPALQGAKRALARRAIDHIMVETYFDKNDARSVTLVDTMCDLLESSGYRANCMRRNGTIHPITIRPFRARKWRSDVMWAKV